MQVNVQTVKQSSGIGVILRVQSNSLRSSRSSFSAGKQNFGWALTTITSTDTEHTPHHGVSEPHQLTGIFICGQPCPSWGHLLPSL